MCANGGVAHHFVVWTENEMAYIHEDVPKILEEVLMDEVAGVAVSKPPV